MVHTDLTTVCSNKGRTGPITALAQLLTEVKSRFFSLSVSPLSLPSWFKIKDPQFVSANCANWDEFFF